MKKGLSVMFVLMIMSAQVSFGQTYIPGKRVALMSYALASTNQVVPSYLTVTPAEKK